MFYEIGFPIKRSWVLAHGTVLPTSVWDTNEHTWVTYDDLTSVVTVLGLHPHPDICIVYEHHRDGTRIRLRTD